jgi:glycyl-tRNA synthetase
MHPKVWEASGHVAGFTDPLVDCKVSKQRYRADQLFFAAVIVDGKTVGYVSALESEKTTEDLQAAAELVQAQEGHPEARSRPCSRAIMTEARPEEIALIPSPATGEPGSLTEPRAFNMMFETHVGPMRDSASVAYLRPETAQGMFVDFKNVVNTGRVKLPFGIAQIGKSFRNEITPRNFIFRSREFEQMEMEYFIHPDADWPRCHEEWLQWCREWLIEHRPARVSSLAPRAPESEAGVLLEPAPSTSCSSTRSACRNSWASPPAATTTSSSTSSTAACREIYFDEATKQKVRPARHRAAPSAWTASPRRALPGLRGRGRQGREGQRGEARRAPPVARASRR